MTLKTESWVDANFVVTGGTTSDDKVGIMITFGFSVYTVIMVWNRQQPHMKYTTIPYMQIVDE